jgi:dTDP-4-amino-4,6-dideoxygalactose transaminase
MNHSLTRRHFVHKTLAAASIGWMSSPTVRAAGSTSTDAKPALLGGKPIRAEPFPSWPKIASNDEKAWSDVLHQGRWCRLDGSYANRFERAWASTLGAKGCVATASGTTALFTSLNGLGVGPGDEVIVPPYTFVATINVVMLQFAVPVFVDTDRETFQIDANKIESAITPRTKVILPVHLGGSSADMDKILDVAKKHKLAVLEDACQAHLAEWRERKVSTIGDLGCFSFQASKNLNSGEGGAILSNDEHLLDRCRSFHDNGRGRRESSFEFIRNGSNHRITEFQAALLNEQLTRLEGQTKVREQNASYLTRLLREIPGITPSRMYDGCTRNAYHLYMFRYDPKAFAGLPRDQFLKALEAEGIPCSGGYKPLNKGPFIEATLQSQHYRNIYPEKELSAYKERNHCPENDKLCDEAVWFTQTMLLGPRSDMDQIAEAIGKIQRSAAQLVKA